MTQATGVDAGCWDTEVLCCMIHWTMRSFRCKVSMRRWYSGSLPSPMEKGTEYHWHASRIVRTKFAVDRRPEMHATTDSNKLIVATGAGKTSPFTTTFRLTSARKPLLAITKTEMKRLQ